LWGSLVVWRDFNMSGTVEDGELHSLDEWEIVSINLDAALVDYQLAGNNVTHESVVTFANATTADIIDVWFNYDSTDSVYVEDYTIDEAVYELPIIRGYGTIRALHIAMSLDNDPEDEDSLISLVIEFSELTSADIYAAN